MVRSRVVALAVVLALVAPAVKPPPAEAWPLVFEALLVAINEIAKAIKGEEKRLLKDIEIEPREQDPAKPMVGDLPGQ